MRNRLISCLLALATSAVSQSPSCTIEGRAIDLDGSPIAGATIGIPGGTSATSDADGRFTVVFSARELVQDHVYVVLAARGRVSYRMPLSTMQRGAVALGVLNHRVDLGEMRMPPGVNFLGRVRSAAGEPLAGVRITGLDELGHHPAWHAVWGSVVTSRADGRFVLSGVFDRAVQVVFEADGYYREVVRAASIASPLDVRLEPSGFVTGPLPTEGGKPFDGWLRIHSEFLNEEHPEESVRGERYRIGVSTRGRFRILGRRATGELAWQSDVLSGPQDDVVLHAMAARPAAMRVRAVDAETGIAIPAVRVARVASRRGSGGSLESALLAELATRPVVEAAEIESSGPDTAVLVGVSAPGYAPSVEGIAFEPGGEFVVRLRSEGRVRGQVVDAAGVPVADAVVECVPEAWKDRVAQKTVRTAADGTFAFDGLLREPMVLRASRTSVSSFAIVPLPLLASPVHDGLRVVLEAGHVVAGTVTGLVANPGMRVLLWNSRLPALDDDDFVAEANHPDPWNTGSTVAVPLTADGRFCFPDCARAVTRLELLVPSAPREGAPIRIPLWAGMAGPETKALAVDVAVHRPGTVSGSLRVAGAPMPTGRFVVLAREVGPARRFERTRQQLSRLRWQLAGGDGAFSLVLPPGQHELEVVDCVTGISLVGREERPLVEVKPGGKVQLDLACSVVEVEVRFKVPQSGRALVDHLACSFGKSLANWELPVFGGGTYGSSGVFVEGRLETATFFAPPGPMGLAVSAVSKLYDGGAEFGGMRGQIEVDLGEDPSRHLVMELQPAIDLGAAAK